MNAINTTCIIGGACWKPAIIVIELSAPVYGPSCAVKASTLGLNDNPSGDECSTQVLAQYNDLDNKLR